MFAVVATYMCMYYLHCINPYTAVAYVSLYVVYLLLTIILLQRSTITVSAPMKYE